MKKLLSKRYVCALFLAFSAVLTALTLVYPDIGILQWVSLVPAGTVILTKATDPTVKLRHMYLLGLQFFVFYFCTVYSWIISMYPLDFTGFSKPLALLLILLAWLGLSLLFSLSYAFSFVLIAYYARGKITARHPIALLFIFAGLWVVFEWMQTLHWTGVPWGRLCLGQVGVSYTLQSASLFGSYFVTFLIVAVNMLLAYAVTERRAMRLCSVIAALVFVSDLLLGIALRFNTLSQLEDSAETVEVAVIQGNISVYEKWDYPSSVTKPIEIHGELTRQAAEQGARIVIWSETTLPYSLVEFPKTEARLCDIATKYGVTLVTGIFTDVYNEDSEPVFYNSVIAMDSEGNLDDTVYHKQHLVPFGEYVPHRDVILNLFPFLGDISMLSYDLTPGTEASIFDLDGVKAGAIICFDSIYESSTIESTRNGAQFIMMATNESWFDGSRAMSMHNDQAKLRAIECGRFIARSANTGISAIISPIGESMCEVDALESGFCVYSIPISDEPQITLYTRIGNLFVYLNIAALIGLIVTNAALKIYNRIKKQ